MSAAFLVAATLVAGPFLVAPLGTAPLGTGSPPAAAAWPAQSASARTSRAPTAEARDYWARTWSELDRADRATRRAMSWRRRVHTLTDAAAERRIASLSQSDADDLFRTRLLQWHLESLKGRSEAPLEPPRPGFVWLPREPWFAARALAPGPLRCEAMLLALSEEDAPDRAQRRIVADAQVREELRTANPEGAADLAQRLDELDPSAERCALAAWSAAQAGRAEDYEQRLAARLAQVSDPAAETLLRLVRARLALARGADLRARVDLGACAAAGSADAAALAARLLLEQGEAQRASVFLRGWVDDPAAGELVRGTWALAVLSGMRRTAFDLHETRGPVPVR